MRKVKSHLFVLIVLLGAVLLVPTPGFTQVYVGVYVGSVIPHEADTSGTLTGSDLTISDTEFDLGVMFGGRLGYWLEALNAPFLGIEAEVYGGFPQISGQTLTVAGSTQVPIQEADIDVLTVGFNFLVRYPVGPIQPYGGVGVGILDVGIDEIKSDTPFSIVTPGLSIRGNTGSTFLSTGDDTAAALQLMGGVRAFITDNVALFGEYKWVTAELEFEDVDFDYSASHVYGGIEFHFGPGVHKK